MNERNDRARKSLRDSGKPYEPKRKAKIRKKSTERGEW